MADADAPILRRASTPSKDNLVGASNGDGATTPGKFPRVAKGTTGQNGKAATGKEVAAYDYCDESGTLLYQSVRFKRNDGSKYFLQRRPDGKGGWIWKTKDIRKVLYRLPELLAADKEETAYVVEGEKDVDNLAKIGMVATTNVSGAGKWLPEYNESLRGRNVIILPDNDLPGRKHASQVHKALTGIAASVGIAELPDLPEKGDVSDWLQAHKDSANPKGDLLAVISRCVQSTPPPVEPEPEPARPKSSQPLPEVGSGPHLTDHGNAQRLVADHGAELRHCHPWKKWLVWQGGRWREDDVGTVHRLAKRTVAKLFRDATSDIEKLQKEPRL